MKLAVCALLSITVCLPVKAESLFEVSASDPLPTEISPTFVVDEIEVKGNTILESEINKLIKPYRNRRVSFEDLDKLTSSIDRLYVSKGYPNSGAYLPPQKIKSGKVKLFVIEGSISDVNVTGTDGLNPEYVSSRLSSLPTPLDSKRLLDKLYVLRQDPLIESVSATLAAGVDPGSSILNVEIKEAKPWSISLSNNNYQSPSIGTNARTLNLEHLNLLGFGDRGSFTYTNTSGSDRLNFGYSVPYGSTGRISAGYGFASNDVIEEAFNALDIESESNYWQLGITQGIVNRAERKVNFGLEFTRQHGETTLLDSPFALSRGADESGNTNVSALRFSQDYIGRGNDSVFALRSVFSLGIDAFDATISKDSPDGRFFSWVGEGQYVKNFSEDLPLLLRSNVQLAGSELVALEQFRAGGTGSVRGYRQDLLLADSGIYAGAEVRLPVWRIDRFDGLVQVAPFFDFATLWNNGDLKLTSNTLVSLGVGLNFNALGDRFNARIDLGIPLTDVKADDHPVSFSLQHSF